jgi:hypothetical protein
MRTDTPLSFKTQELYQDNNLPAAQGRSKDGIYRLYPTKTVNFNLLRPF